MSLILSEPMKKVVEIPKIFAKIPLKTQNLTQNALTGSAHHPGEKGGKKTKKTKKTPAPFFRRKKTFFRESPVFLAALLTGRAGGGRGRCPLRPALSVLPTHYDCHRAPALWPLRGIGARPFARDSPVPRGGQRCRMTARSTRARMHHQNCFPPRGRTTAQPALASQLRSYQRCFCFSGVGGSMQQAVHRTCRPLLVRSLAKPQACPLDGPSGLKLGY
jgi:hypothetical protein